MSQYQPTSGRLVITGSFGVELHAGNEFMWSSRYPVVDPKFEMQERSKEEAGGPTMTHPQQI